MAKYAATRIINHAALVEAGTEPFVRPLIDEVRAYAEADGLTIDPNSAAIRRYEPHPDLDGAEGFPENAVVLELTVEAH